jgi:hypothetical protein
MTDTLHKVFYVPVYSCHIDRYSEIDNAVTDDIVNKIVIPNHDEWHCDVDTSFAQRLKDTSWLRIFYNIMHPKLEEYFVKAFNRNDVNIKFGIPWINRYNNGKYQERHNHLAASDEMFSYCYFHKLPSQTGCADFKFKSNIEDLEHLQPEEVKSQRAFKPEVNQYDVIIFPSWLDHLVTTHKLDSPRVTISGNFGISIKK